MTINHGIWSIVVASIPRAGIYQIVTLDGVEMISCAGPCSVIISRRLR